MKYGISELAIVPIRADVSDKAEMVNQLLFGEHFKVLESRVKWSKIRLAHDKYEGWICNKQWSEIDKNSYEELERHDPTLTTELLDIVIKNTHQTVPLGTTLMKERAQQVLEIKQCWLITLCSTLIHLIYGVVEHLLELIAQVLHR